MTTVDGGSHTAEMSVHRRLSQPVAARFYLSGSEPEPDELYDGPARLTVDGRDVAGRVRLTGHFDAVAGRCHAAVPPGRH